MTWAFIDAVYAFLFSKFPSRENGDNPTKLWTRGSAAVSVLYGFDRNVLCLKSYLTFFSVALIGRRKKEKKGGRKRKECALCSWQTRRNEVHLTPDRGKEAATGRIDETVFHNFGGKDVWAFFYAVGVYKTHLPQKVPFYVCCSTVIINNVPFHSQKCLSLHDKWCGHPNVGTHRK